MNAHAQPAEPTAASLTPMLQVVGSCDVARWGLTPSEWLARAVGRAGARIGGDVVDGQPLLLVRAGWVVHPSLAKNLVTTRDVLLTDELRERVVAIHLASAAGGERAEAARRLVADGALDIEGARQLGLAVMTPAQLGTSFNSQLRKKGDRPYALSLETTPLDEIERRTFAQSYKGVTDVVTKYVWPTPARHVTKWAAERKIRPNTVTTVSLICVLAATYFFWQGQFVAGLLAGWMMALLDTVDGKLARVTMTYSFWGDIYDHGIDHVHPPFWWAAWWLGLGAAGYSAQAGLHAPAIIVIVAGYFACRIIEGLFLYSFKFQIHTWRAIDSTFRLVSARRNPNLLILTASALIGRPDLGLLALAVWTAVSFVFHLARLFLAWSIRLSGRPVSSWLAEARA